MAPGSPADVIDAYRRRKERRSPFTFGDISKALLFLIILASSGYILVAGAPELPTLIELKTNTPTYTPSITPTASQTATVTSTPTETPDPENQCNCPSPVILVVTATFGATNTTFPLSTETATVAVSLTSTLVPAETLTPTETQIPTPTLILYTVQRGDTLGGVALRFGVTTEALQALNNMDNTMIFEGQVLQIPGQ
jgi:LysM repeat protein